MPVMMRGPIVCQLCMERYKLTNETRNSNYHTSMFSCALVYNPSEVFKTSLEFFGTNIGRNDHLVS